jgi:hypothetical protein
LPNQFLLAQKLEERAAPKQSLSGVCPLAKRMTPVISVLLAAATTMFGLAILIAKGDLLKSAPGWLVPLVFTLSAYFFLLAAILAIVNWKRERKRNALPPPSPPPPSVQVNQENKQVLNQNFRFGGQDDATVTAKLQKTRDEEAVLDFMKRTHPTVAYKVDEIATGVTLNLRDTWDALERLETKGKVRRLSVDQAVGGALWFLNELDR